MRLRYPVPLEPNRTYTHRQAWIVLASEPGTPVVGVLVVREKKRLVQPWDVSRYAVVELAFDQGRRFKLTKADRTVYHVLLPGGGTDRCDCTGYDRFGRCKHTEALRAVERAGGLPWALDYPALTPTA